MKKHIIESVFERLKNIRDELEELLFLLDTAIQENKFYTGGQYEIKNN